MQTCPFFFLSESSVWPELSVCPELSTRLELPVCSIMTMEVSFELFVSLELSVCPVTTMEVGSELFVHPELSVIPVMTTEVIPLSSTLPVLVVTNWCVWAAYTFLEDPVCHDIPPSLPLPPPLLCPLSFSVPLPLHPAGPSAHPQPSICVVGSLWVCQSPLVL